MGVVLPRLKEILGRWNEHAKLLSLFPGLRGKFIGYLRLFVAELEQLQYFHKDSMFPSTMSTATRVFVWRI